MEFAYREIEKYSCLMGINSDIKLIVDPSSFDPERFHRFNSKFDDAFKIRVDGGKGEIKGTNERAVLIGIYHYFKKQGCRFLRPGKDGEYIPRIDKCVNVNEEWYAKTRYRGTTSMHFYNCYTGINSAIDFLDWMPKMAMNMFFIELEDYYSLVEPVFTEKGIEFSRGDYLLAHEKIMAAIKERHILFHNAGHGWTIKMMEGISEISFSETQEQCLNTEILAKTKGERRLFNNKPMHTNLCYSKESVRKNLAKLVLEYAQAHPETDFIHFWLGDYFSNLCECEVCKQKRHSDWYIIILNEIDRLLTENGIDTKVVFLIYFELLYPPVSERILNPDRFVMMFCPYGRDFSKPYSYWKPRDYVPKLNNDFDRTDMDMSLYLKQLEEWKNIFDGDCFAFDYIFYDPCYFQDLCHVNYPKIPYTDCVEIKKFGLNGKIECGSIRSMTPTAFTFYAMFTELFYGNTSYDELHTEYFEGLYGKNQKVSAFLEEINQLIPTTLELAKENVETIIQKITSFKSEIQSAEVLPAHKANLDYFNYFLDILLSYTNAIKAKAFLKNGDSFEKSLEEFKNALYDAEKAMPNYLAPYYPYVYLKASLNNLK